MISSLTKGMTEERKIEFAAMAKDARPVLKQLRVLLQAKVVACNSKRLQRRNYFMPSWSQYQADCNGYLRGIEEIDNVLKSISDQESTND